MHYELWDVGTGNCIGRYASEAAALERVQALVEQFGAPYADELELAAEDDLGNFQGTQTGVALLSRVATILAGTAR
jgi:hypothetical protein